MSPANSAEALSQLQQSQAQAQNPNDILNAQRQQLGVPQAEQTVTGLRGAIDSTTKLLKQIAPGVMGRTGNSLVTSGQANRIIQNETAPVSATLEDQGEKYNRANEDASKLRSDAQTAAGNVYQAQQDKQSYLQNLYNTLYGREQDEAARVRQAAQDAEDTRRYNASLKGSSSSVGSKSSGSSSKSGSSKAPTQTQVKGQITSGLYSVKGNDGYVSPQDYARAYVDWVKSGLSASSFDSTFKGLKNPKNGYYNYAIQTAK